MKHFCERRNKNEFHLKLNFLKAQQIAAKFALVLMLTDFFYSKSVI